MAFVRRGLARPDLGHGDCVEIVISLELARMTCAATGIAIEQFHAPHGIVTQRSFAFQVLIKRAVIRTPFPSHKRGQRVRDVGKADPLVFSQNLGKSVAVGGDRGHAVRNNLPCPAFTGQKTLPYSL